MEEKGWGEPHGGVSPVAGEEVAKTNSKPAQALLASGKTRIPTLDIRRPPDTGHDQPCCPRVIIFLIL